MLLKLNNILRGGVQFPTDGDKFYLKSVTRICGGTSVSLVPTVKVWMREENQMILEISLSKIVFFVLLFFMPHDFYGVFFILILRA